MLLDLSPLIRYREYRFIFFGQLISFFGSMMTYVALPYQIYHLTHSSFVVGMIGIVQLVPLLFTALLGGALADHMDRRKLLLLAETMLASCSLILALNSMSSAPRIWIIFLVAAVASGTNGFHRPALNSMIPRLVARDDIPAVSALNSFRGTIASVAGPAMGGVLIASYGLTATYVFDVFGFLFSLSMLLQMSPMPS
jgi:MFS family permease